MKVELFVFMENIIIPVENAAGVLFVFTIGINTKTKNVIALIFVSMEKNEINIKFAIRRTISSPSYLVVYALLYWTIKKRKV